MLIAAYLLTTLAQSPKDELLRLADAVGGLKRASFSYRRDLSYQSDGYKHTLTADMYVEFGRGWAPIRARFQATSSDSFEVFNGQTYRLMTKGKEMVREEAPKASYFDPLSVLKNSLIGLSASLRAAANDAGASIEFGKDATGNPKILLDLKGKELGLSKSLVPVEYTPRYEISVDTKSGLPTKIVQFLRNRKDTITTVFTNYNLAPKEPDNWEQR
jgi:hypothetical protein